MNTFVIASFTLVVAVLVVIIFHQRQNLAHVKQRMKKFQTQTIMFEFGKKQPLTLLQIFSKTQFVISQDKSDKEEVVALASKRIQHDIQSLKSFEQLRNYFNHFEKEVKSEDVFRLYQEIIEYSGSAIATIIGAEVERVKQIQSNADKKKSLKELHTVLKNRAFQGVSYHRSTVSMIEKLLKDLGSSESGSRSVSSKAADA